ncbi:uncharacterized protein N7500_004736 [Penicillium coprophilum]|uniref:uncharacterized protein n=1 Tax=Penicillium coprophilum TaxID=36646 RepID=UPI00238F3D5C|nr:uncharacterized protein N7500_004736 [Penicillium coprophilum]KAJ5162906.1 hypothetical protein N7500_004736 [Penicillium coprophilum]
MSDDSKQQQKDATADNIVLSAEDTEPGTNISLTIRQSQLPDNKITEHKALTSLTGYLPPLKRKSNSTEIHVHTRRTTNRDYAFPTPRRGSGHLREYDN